MTCFHDANQRWFSTIGMMAALLGIFAVYGWLYQPFFPNPEGEIGYDYSYAVPHLLAGYYRFLSEGIFSVPWFSPHACGGFALAAHPHSFYFSIYQLLTFFMAPSHASQYSFFVFAGIGQIGFYVLMRQVFSTPKILALAASTLFLFNSFYTFRMIIGHMTFHSYMLLPWLLYCACLRLDTQRTALIAKNVGLGILLGMLAAYIFLSGGVHITLPMGLAVLAIYAIYVATGGAIPHFWQRVVIGAIVAVVLSSSKLSMATHLIQHVDRSFYALPGFTSLWDQLIHVGYAMFFEHPVGVYQHLVNYDLYRHAKFEWEFSVGVMPLICLPVLTIYHLVKGNLHVTHLRVGALCLALVILLLPLAVTFHTPAWHAILQNIPLLKNSSLLFRWYCIYIPCLIFCTIGLLQALPYPRLRTGVAGLVILGTMGVFVLRDNTFYTDYHNYHYSPAVLDAAHAKATSTGHVQPITMIGEDNAFGMHSVLTGDLMGQGISALNCYEPLFGYSHENFPQQTLHNGSAIALKNGVYNMKNPACYVFPAENHCAPGDHFRADQAKQLEQFLAYQSFEFAMPTYQKVINVVCVIGWFICIGYLIVFSLYFGFPRLLTRHA